MRILIVTNHFWPESFRINDLAVGMTQRGHAVTVLTGLPDYPAGKAYPGYGVFRKRIEVWRGIRVIRFPRLPRGRGGSVALAINYLSAIVGSTLTAPFVARDRFDVVFVFETSPVTIGLPALIVRWLQRVPVVFWVLDLWPESLSATGAIRSPMLIRQVRRLVRFIYRRCDRILVSSRGFVRCIEGVGGYRGAITYFPNWVEPEYLIPPSRSTHDLPALPTGFRVMFAGNIGAAQDFETILTAAERCRHHDDVHWLIVGDGRRASWVVQEVARRGVGDRVHLLGRFPAEMMPSLYAEADVLLLTLRRDPIFALTAPGKLQSYLASGKPIVAGLDGEGAELVVEAGAGLACPAESPDQLAALVMNMRAMSHAERAAMGARGRQYCHDSFDREAQFTRLEQLLNEVVQSAAGAPQHGSVADN